MIINRKLIQKLKFIYPLKKNNAYVYRIMGNVITTNFMIYQCITILDKASNYRDNSVVN